MDNKNYSYVFLRGIKDFENGFPAWGAKKDVDLLVYDNAIYTVPPVILTAGI